MSEESDDKQHEPTQKRLDDARRKGEIAKSNDLITAAGYGGALLAAAAFGAQSLERIGTLLGGLLARADAVSAQVFQGRAAAALSGPALGLAGALTPWLALPAVLALLAVLGQRALIVTPDKLAPKLSRISPLAMAKQKFGRAGLFEFFKSLAKLLIYSAVLGLCLAGQREELLQTMRLEPGLVAAAMARMLTGLMILVVLVALGLGVVDALFQRSEHLRKNRMSRKELMDEMKDAEGDPVMKQQRRQRAVSIAMNRMLADVPGADVVIVNPTHYSVALKWDRSSLGAPVCVAKGVDEIAARIREIAIENAVPIQSDPATARALYADTELGEEIDPDHYRAVAAAIRFAEAMRRRARAR